jgi:hypothetical protein
MKGKYVVRSEPRINEAKFVYSLLGDISLDCMYWR